MRQLLLICGLLLHMALLPVSQANTQNLEAAFDYDAALATSQAAIGNSVGAHRFTNADGNPVSLDQLRGKPLVISMVFTSCFQVCPMTTRNLSGVVEKARDALGDDSFNVALVGFDTAVDTPDAMRFFAGKQGVYGKNWQLLSADQPTIDALSRDLGFLYFPSSAGFDHLIQATVIDAEGRVYRQVYGQVFDTPLLVDPLIELVLGRTPPEQPLLASLVNRVKLFCTTYDPARDGYFFDYSLFIGMLIGAIIIGITGIVMVRGWRSQRQI